MQSEKEEKYWKTFYKFFIRSLITIHSVSLARASKYNQTPSPDVPLTDVSPLRKHNIGEQRRCWHCWGVSFITRMRICQCLTQPMIVIPVHVLLNTITKICPCNIQRFFLASKNENFELNFFLYFSYFCSKHRLWVHVRTASSRRF